MTTSVPQHQRQAGPQTISTTTTTTTTTLFDATHLDKENCMGGRFPVEKRHSPYSTRHRTIILQQRRQTRLEAEHNHCEHPNCMKGGRVPVEKRLSPNNKRQRIIVLQRRRQARLEAEQNHREHRIEATTNGAIAYDEAATAESLKLSNIPTFEMEEIHRERLKLGNGAFGSVVYEVKGIFLDDHKNNQEIITYSSSSIPAECHNRAARRSFMAHHCLREGPEIRTSTINGNITANENTVKTSHDERYAIKTLGSKIVKGDNIRTFVGAMIDMTTETWILASIIPHHPIIINCVRWRLTTIATTIATTTITPLPFHPAVSMKKTTFWSSVVSGGCSGFRSSANARTTITTNNNNNINNNNKNNKITSERPLAYQDLGSALAHLHNHLFVDRDMKPPKPTSGSTTGETL
jgi:hypothetical protein